MQITLRDSLPYTSIEVAYGGRRLVIADVIVDTGSAHSVFSVDDLATIGVMPEPDDILYSVRGIGGVEVVFSKTLDFLRLGECSLANFDIEVGAMDYGFPIRGILGMDFLLAGGAMIDLDALQITFPCQNRKES